MQPDDVDPRREALSEPLVGTPRSDGIKRRPSIQFHACPGGTESALRLTPGTTLRGTVFNLVNTMAGAGLLGLPYAASQAGILVFTLLCVVVALLVDLTSWMILVCMDATKEDSYGKLAERLYGPGLGFVCDLAVFVNNFGVCVALIVILGDILAPFLIAVGVPAPFNDRSVVQCIVASFILLPLSSLRSMGAMRHVALLSMCMIFTFAIILSAMGLGIIDVSPPADAHAALLPGSIVQACAQAPVAFFAFLLQQNLPFLYTELRRQKLDDVRSKFATKRCKMMRAVHLTIFMVFIAYVMSASLGCKAFPDTVAHNILLNIDTPSFHQGLYIRTAYAVVVCCKYPSMLFSCRASMHRLMWHFIFVVWPRPTDVAEINFFEQMDAFSPGGPLPSPADAFASPYQLPGEAYMKQSQSSFKPVPHQTIPPPGEALRLFEVFVTVVGSLVVGILVPNISVVFGFVGGACGSMLIFVLPGLLYLKVLRRFVGVDELFVPGVSTKLRGPWLGEAIFCFGVLLGVGSTASFMLAAE